MAMRLGIQQPSWRNPCLQQRGAGKGNSGMRQDPPSAACPFLSCDGRGEALALEALALEKEEREAQSEKRETFENRLRVSSEKRPE